jgi:hypothetical protein
VPIEKFVSIAAAIVFGLMITHPLTWRTHLLKLQYSILHEVSDTRSWGNPSIFKHHPSHTHKRGHL